MFGMHSFFFLNPVFFFEIILVSLKILTIRVKFLYSQQALKIGMHFASQGLLSHRDKLVLEQDTNVFATGWGQYHSWPASFFFSNGSFGFYDCIASPCHWRTDAHLNI